MSLTAKIARARTALAALIGGRSLAELEADNAQLRTLATELEAEILRQGWRSQAVHGTADRKESK